MSVTLDQLAVMGLRYLYQNHVAPKTNGVNWWDNGLGTLAAGAVQAVGIPPVSGPEIAAGALKMLGVGGPRLKPRGLYRPIRRVSIEDGKIKVHDVEPVTIDVEGRR